MKLETKNLKRLYSAAVAILILIVIFTPLLIKDGVSFLTEEILEVVIIGFLFAAGFVLNKFYEREIHSRERALKEAWEHIGEINLLTEGFKEAIIDIDKYPENKKEMKNLLKLMSEKILSIVNTPYVMLRLILLDEMKTLSENLQARNNLSNIEIKISNKELVENGENNEYEILASSAQNTAIKTFCIFPKIKITDEQKIFIQKIINDLTMLHIIFNSEYYQR